MKMMTTFRAALCAVLVSIGTSASAQILPSGAVSGTISTAGADCVRPTNCFGFSTDGLASFGVFVNVAASGTFVFEVSQDATSLSDGHWGDPPTGDTGTTADGSFYFTQQGFLWFRVRASAISGAATISVARGEGAGGGSSTGAIVDGASSSIKATVFDLANSNPLAAQLVDVNGTAIDLSVVDPCTGVVKLVVPFSISSATTTQLVAASASNKLYVCAINVGPVSAAANVALVEDDTSACASPTAGMAGGTTAGTGWNIAANGGLTFGNGLGTVTKTAATNRYVCLITSSTAQVSGVLTYALAP